MGFPFWIDALESEVISLIEKDILHGDPDISFFDPVIIGYLKPPHTEAFIPFNSVQKLLDGNHRRL